MSLIPKCHSLTTGKMKMSNYHNCRRCRGHLKSVTRAGYKRAVKCMNELCGSEFVETGLCQEYLPNEFFVGHTYRTVQYLGTVKTILDIKIRKRQKGFVDIEINGLFTVEHILVKHMQSHVGTVEVLKLDKGLTGKAFDLMPYNLVNDKGESA